jgi:hypothetical protein
MTSHKLDESASGVFIISATPFTESGALDLESADRLVDLERRIGHNHSRHDGRGAENGCG